MSLITLYVAPSLINCIYFHSDLIDATAAVQPSTIDTLLISSSYFTEILFHLGHAFFSILNLMSWCTDTVAQILTILGEGEDKV